MFNTSRFLVTHALYKRLGLLSLLGFLFGPPLLFGRSDRLSSLRALCVFLPARTGTSLPVKNIERTYRSDDPIEPVL